MDNAKVMKLWLNLMNERKGLENAEHMFVEALSVAVGAAIGQGVPLNDFLRVAKTIFEGGEVSLSDPFGDGTPIAQA